MTAKTDRELLELAAKAAGVELTWDDDEPLPRIIVRDEDDWWGGDEWLPLDDDGDALRLAVKLRLYVFCYGDNAVAATCVVPPNCDVSISQVVLDDDWCDATRRAIVRAAAAIGERHE